MSVCCIGSVYDTCAVCVYVNVHVQAVVANLIGRHHVIVPIKGDSGQAGVAAKSSVHNRIPTLRFNCKVERAKNNKKRTRCKKNCN